MILEQNESTGLGSVCIIVSWIKHLIVLIAAFLVGVAANQLMTQPFAPSGAPAQVQKYADPPLLPEASSPQTDPGPYTEVLSVLTQPFHCSDPVVMQLVAVLMKKYPNGNFVALSEGQACDDLFERTDVDLNNDGSPEILLRGVPCGGTGNCSFNVFQRTRSGYRVLLDSTDYIDRAQMGEQVLKRRTNGYSDVLLRGHFSAAETSFTYFRFNGRKYVESHCLFEVHDYTEEGAVIWRFITCHEFYKRLSP